MEHIGRIVYFKTNAFQLREVFAVLKDLFIEADLRFTLNGIVVRGMDPQRTTTTIVSLFHPEEYVWRRPIKIGAYMHTIYKILRGCHHSEMVELIVTEDQPDVLNISLDQGSKISLLSRNISYDDIMLPDIQYDVEAVVPGKQALRTIKEIGHFSKIVDLYVNTLTEKIYAKTKTVFATAVIELGSCTVQSPQIEEFSMSFDVRHLDHFCKHAGGQDVTIRFKNGYPLSLGYHFGTLGNIEFFVSQVLYD